MDSPTQRQVGIKQQPLGTATKPTGLRHQHLAYDPASTQAEPGEHLPFALMFSPAGTSLDTFITNTIPLAAAQDRRPGLGLPTVGAP